MTTKKKLLLILLVLFGTPLLAAGLGAIGAARTNDTSGLAGAFAIGIAYMGVAVGIILGMIIGFVTKNNPDQRFTVAGYIVPPLLALLYVAFFSILAPTG